MTTPSLPSVNASASPESEQRVETGVRTVIGNFYMVPCIKVEPAALVAWMPRNGWVPVIGPKHRDAEFIDFPHLHMHIDWRFIGAAGWRSATSAGKRPHAKVVTNDGTDYFARTLTRDPEPRRMQCKRDMPTFPERIGVRGDIDYGNRWAQLERAQAFVCNKLKPGNVCPHRGINLTPFAQPDGTAVCPGHGLRWNLATGELMPRFAGAHTSRGAA